MIKAAFWLSAAIILYTYVGYPAWLYLRSQIAAHPWKRAEITPSISIIMAVHNGEALLREKIEHLLTLDYPQERIEVIVVSDGSDDGTADILRTVSHPKVRSILLDQQQGKAAALNPAIRVATGELLVFVDLRPKPEPEAVRKLVGNFADPTVGCAGGKLCLHREGMSGTNAAVGDLYWRYEQWIRLCEAASDSTTSVAGCFYAVRRALVGDFPPGLILDDMYQPLHVVCQGYRSIIDGSARVWDTLPNRTAGEFRRKVRTLAGNFQLLQLAPWTLSKNNRLRWQLVSHKLLRLGVPVCLLALQLTSWILRGHLFYRTALVLQIGFCAIAVLGAANFPVFRRVTGPVSAFVLLNAAAVVGFWKFCFHRGPLWKIWIRTPKKTFGVQAGRAGGMQAETDTVVTSGVSLDRR